MNKTIIIQGTFPGGKPHASVLLQSKMSKPNTHGIEAYPLNNTRLILNSTGHPLSTSILQKMESVFKTDFSKIRIHSGRGEAESIGALAFTTGNDIYFANGEYNPDLPHGQRLLGHELTHVVQQKNGRIRNYPNGGITIINDYGLEAEAERMGLAVLTQAKAIAPVKNKYMPLIQMRAETEEEVGRHQRLKAWANNWLKEYGKKSNMKASWFNHIFLGLPFDGTPRDKAKPTGFHAYYGEGALRKVPSNIRIISTTGRKGTFHQVNWCFTDSPGGTSKSSTMFPETLSQEKVIALILINTVDAWKTAPNPFPPKTASGKSVSSQNLSDVFGIGRAWTLQQSGDTVYPKI
jgi:hypothetical protein